MLHAPDVLVEPAARLFSRLLRIRRDASATGAYGGDVGEDEADCVGPEPEPEWLREAGDDVLPDKHAVTADARAAAPPLAASELKTWLVRTLGERRGVLAAWPAIAGLGARADDRVLAMSDKVGAGHAWWWLWHLQRIRCSYRDSYAPVGTADDSERVTVYRVAGEPDRSFEWFPGGGSYGIERGVVDAYLHYGLAITVRELTSIGHAPSLEAQQQQAALAVYHGLDAATHGIGPPVFATMLVHDGDEYVATQDALLPANAVITHEMVAALARERSQNLSAIVSVTQLHSFRLGEMLRAYVHMGAAENREGARKEIAAAAEEIAHKTRRLADLKTLKLNVCPDTIVFCPELVDTPDGDWELRGHAVRSAEFDRPPGAAYHADFDPRLCKRFAAADRCDGYDASAATALMLLTLLATTRAQHGEKALEAVRAGVRVTLVRSLRDAAFHIDEFGRLVDKSFMHGRVERGALPAALFEGVANDLASAQRQGGDARVDTLLVPLVTMLSGARAYRPAEVPPQQQLDAQRDADAECRARLSEACAARHARRLVRCRDARASR